MSIKAFMVINNEQGQERLEVSLAYAPRDGEVVIINIDGNIQKIVVDAVEQRAGQSGFRPIEPLLVVYGHATLT